MSAAGRKVVFVDTSILRCLIGMDGDDRQQKTAGELEARQGEGQQFVIPVTAIIETGNQIAQLSADRRTYAERLRNVIDESRGPNPPWIVRAVTWDESFLDALVGGDSTGSDLVTLLGNKVGTGDVAILVELDQFVNNTAYVSTEIWTLDADLRAHGSSPH